MNIQKVVCIFHHGRCGSTVLSDMLNQHSTVKCFGEIIKNYKNSDQNTIINYIKNKCNETSKTAIFEIKPWHITKNHMTIKNFVDNLGRIGVTHIIILERRNFLLREISSQLLKSQNRYQNYTNIKKVGEINKIKLNTDILINKFQRIENSFTEIRKNINIKPLNLVYENDILSNSPKTAYDKCQKYLSLDPETPKIYMRKLNSTNFRDMVSNANQIISILKNTKYEWMIY